MAGGRSKRAADPLTDIQPATKRRTRADYKENDGKSPHLPSHPAFITESNAKTSPFLRLPGEIRNMIYELVICNHRIRIQSFGTSLWADQIVGNCDELHGAAVKDICNVLRVCRQVREETVTTVYLRNTFVFTHRKSFMMWYRKRTRWQKEAVNRIELLHSWNYPYPMRRRTSNEAFTTLLPNLQAIVLTVGCKWQHQSGCLSTTEVYWLVGALKCFEKTEHGRIDITVQGDKYQLAREGWATVPISVSAIMDAHASNNRLYPRLRF